MQIVIEIDKDQYEMVKQYSGSYNFGYAIANGTVLPEKVTNGDMIIALFPQCPTYPLCHDIGFYADESKQKMVVAFPKEWWNAPYKEGKE